MLDAFKKYDGTKNAQFKSYAQFRIRGAILDSLRDLDWSPRVLRRKARQIEEARSQLAATLLRAPSEPEMATELELKLEDYQRLIGELRGLDLVSIQEERGDDANTNESLQDVLPAIQEDPYALCLKSEMRHMLGEAICKLPARERQLLALYYFDELTMKQIGDVLGVVESRVSQMHTSVVSRLRISLERIMRRQTRQIGKASQLPLTAAAASAASW